MPMYIENDRPDHDFVMVPTRLIQDNTLSRDARIILIWACSHPRGFLIHVNELRAALALSVRAWRKAMHELRERGALSLWSRACPKTGRMLGSSHKISWANWLTPTESPKAAHSGPPVEKPIERPIHRESHMDPSRVPNETPEGSKRTALNREKEKNARARARSGGAERRDRNDAASRRDAMQPAADGGGGDEDRVIPPLERRRELARELGLDPDSSDLWRLTGSAVGDVP